MFRHFIITWNNPTETLENFSKNVTEIGFKYFAGQIEKGENGTRHIQAAFGGKRCRIDQIKKAFPKLHIEIAKHPRAAIEYCTKSDTRIEGPIIIGEPVFASNVKEDVAAKNRKILEIGAEAAVEQGLIRIEKYQQAKKSIDLYKNTTLECKSLDVLENQWIYGPPGAGKSRSARECDSLFIKPINKWWDGYADQKTILIDDFELDHKCLGHYLKIWADHYPFRAETKGGFIYIRPTKIVVTSNYHPADIWTDPMMIQAILRRFNLINFNQ